MKKVADLVAHTYAGRVLMIYAPKFEVLQPVVVAETILVVDTLFGAKSTS